MVCFFRKMNPICQHRETICPNIATKKCSRCEKVFCIVHIKEKILGIEKSDSIVEVIRNYCEECYYSGDIISVFELMIAIVIISVITIVVTVAAIFAAFEKTSNKSNVKKKKYYWKKVFIS